MKKLMIVAAAFAFFAGSAMACGSCAAHAKKDKKECTKDGKKCDKSEKKECDKSEKKDCDKSEKKDCDKCPSKKKDA